MARLQRFNATRPVQRSNRKFTWIGGVSTAFGGTSLAAATSILISAFDIRGILSVVSDQVAANEKVHGAFGVLVVSGEAFDAGVASIPTPFSEASDDRWLYHTYWAAPIQVIAGQSSDQIPSQTVIDGKAMRKVNSGDVVVFMIENGNNVHGAIFVHNSRLGIKLH